MGNRCSIHQSEEINCWLEQSPENRLYRPFRYFWATLYIYQYPPLYMYFSKGYSGYYEECAYYCTVEFNVYFFQCFNFILTRIWSKIHTCIHVHPPTKYTYTHIKKHAHTCTVCYQGSGYACVCVWYIIMAVQAWGCNSHQECVSNVLILCFIHVYENY